MGLFDSKVSKMLKTTFEPDNKLYSEYLRKIGWLPLNGDKYTDKDIEAYLKISLDVCYDEKENQFLISEGAFIIQDLRTGVNVHETINWDEHNERIEELHEECIQNNVLVKYSFENTNNASFMIYPYTSIVLGKSHIFDMDNTTIRFVGDDIEISGIAKVEILEDMDTSEEEGYSKQTVIDIYTEPCSMKIPNIFKSLKGNKELSKLLKKSKMYKA